MNRAAATIAAIRAQKQRIRKELLRERQRRDSTQAHSRSICGRVTGLSEYCDARTIATYVAMPAEVQTRGLILSAWSDDKEVAVPCCVGGELRLFHLKSMEDLAPRTLGILEPRDDLRKQKERWYDVSQIDVFLVPGVAFDRLGGRLGHGKGYYDRLLSGASQNASKIALAFEWQIIDRVPMTAGDVFMDGLVSEAAVYRCSNS